MSRYLIVVNVKEQSIASTKGNIEKAGVNVVDTYDFINTLVVDGDPAAVKELKKTINSIVSIEKEGHVSTQNDIE